MAPKHWIGQERRKVRNANFRNCFCKRTNWPTCSCCLYSKDRQNTNPFRSILLLLKLSGIHRPSIGNHNIINIDLLLKHIIRHNSSKASSNSRRRYPCFRIQLAPSPQYLLRISQNDYLPSNTIPSPSLINVILRVGNPCRIRLEERPLLCKKTKTTPLVHNKLRYQSHNCSYPRYLCLLPATF